MDFSDRICGQRALSELTDGRHDDTKRRGCASPLARAGGPVASLVDLNATQAAIRCGYSARTAKQQGSRLLTNVDVSAAIAEAT